MRDQTAQMRRLVKVASCVFVVCKPPRKVFHIKVHIAKLKIKHFFFKETKSATMNIFQKSLFSF